jgi:SOS-response transcriptional repressor LexA
MTETKQPKQRRGASASDDATPAQERILNTIRTFISEQGMSPTMQEIASILGTRTPTVHEQITFLIEKG